MLKIWDADNFRRTLAGICCFLAPAALLAALLVHPGEGDGLVATVAAEPGRIQGSALLTVLCAVLFVPALAGIAHVVRGRGVVLTHLGVGLMIIGAIAHGVFAGFQIVLSAAITGGVDQAQLEPMVADIPNAGFAVVLATFLLTFFPGLVLLAIGLWRSGAVPAWTPVGLVALAVTDFVPVEVGRLVGALVPAFGVVCFGAIGWVLLRMTDQAWRSPAAPAVVEATAAPVPTP